MLKGVPENISSSLLKILAEMGHGDSIAIVDHFYPAYSKCDCVIEAKGNTVPEMIASILQLIPLDVEYSDYPVSIMKPDLNMESILETAPPVWDEICSIIKKIDPKAKIEFITRTDFYEEALNSYATVSTSDVRPYGCVILKKGVE